MIYPIQLIPPTRTYPRKKVEWKLSNVCNYNCSFCFDHFKKGDQPWLGLETYINVSKQLIKEIKDSGCLPIFHLTGGEPTLNLELIDLLRYLKSENSMVNLMSNGSKSPEYWKSIAKENLLDFLFVGVHSSQEIDINNIIEVINLFKDSSTIVAAYVTAPPESFDIAVSTHNRLLEEAVVVSSLKTIFKNWSSEESVANYTIEQLNTIKSNVHIKSKLYPNTKPAIGDQQYKSKLIYSDGTVEQYHVYQLLAGGLNNFYQWECEIGKHSIIIDYNKIYRGLCHVEGVIHTIDNPSFAKTSVICPNAKCVCGGDLSSGKQKPA